MYRGITWTQAEKDGGPVLKEEGSFRKINGFLVNTRWGLWACILRRDWKP